MNAGRVWVVGLDGAPWSLIRPWAEAGELPNLRALMQGGAWGNLESTIQPLTPCAWSTFITGSNPGRHGLFDFTRRVPGSYQVEVVNATHRQGNSLWSFLSEAGRRVAVLNVPMTYPPEPVNGVMISGLDTPGTRSPYTYPASLAEEIADRHVVTVSTSGVSHAQYLRRTLATVDKRFEVLRQMLRRERYDFLMKVIVETDAIQHCSWHLMAQPDMPDHDAILQVYRRVDQHLGDLVAEMPGDTTLLIISDHGAGPIDKVVYLDRWLARQGWLGLRSSSLRAELLMRAVGLGQRYLPPALKARLRGQADTRAQVESVLRFGAVDWKRTRAFAWGNQGNINLNLAGREPQGNVRPGAEADRLKSEIVSSLLELRDPETGETVVQAVFRREEIYSGPMTALAPDLLIRWRGDRYVAKTLYQRTGGKIFGRRLVFGRAGSTYALEQTGTHTMQGICLCYGARVVAGTRFDGARLLDLAPTILWLLDVPIPAQMEGQVLADAFCRAQPETAPHHQAGSGLPTMAGSAAGDVPSIRTADRKVTAERARSALSPQASGGRLPHRIMVLGLDGATWDLLGPWIEAGELPHLAALRTRSVWGRLRSTIPPFSATAWATFATGVNPGAHGVFDFWARSRPGEERHPIGSGQIGAPTLWRRLSEAGRRVAVVGVPMTYPPQPVNGVLVSGMMTPSEAAAYTYPAELKDQLRVAAGGTYRADPYSAITQSKAFLREALYWLEHRERAHRWLMERESWDCFISVIQEPDPIQHYFWTFLQPGHPDYEAPNAQEYRELVLDVFRQIDALIGQRLRALDERTTFVLMSDHGAGEARHWFNLNRWLVERGWLVLKKGTARRSPVSTGQVSNVLRDLDILKLRGRLGNLTRQRLKSQIDRLLAPAIDWSRTRAYAGSPSAEAVYINLAGREPTGIVQAGTEYEQLRAEIQEGLQALRGPDGATVVEAMHRGDELYRGAFVDRAPDLALEIGQRPYIISESLASGDLFEPIPHQAARGRHRPDGILLIHGAAVGEPGERPPARIEDVAPTVLHLLGFPVLPEMDGLVLTGWLAPEGPFEMGDRRQVAPAQQQDGWQAAGTGSYSSEDVAMIEERLRSLGYLD